MTLAPGGKIPVPDPLTLAARSAQEVRKSGHPGRKQTPMAGRRDQFWTGAVERPQEDEAEVVGGGALEEDEAEVVGGGARWKMAGEEAGRRRRGRTI